MTTFDDRERGFENKFAHDADLRFRAEARRNRLVGLWAAGLLNKTGAEAEAYAASVVKADFQEAGDADVLRKLTADLAGVADVATIRTRMDALLLEAMTQIDSGV